MTQSRAGRRAVRLVSTLELCTLLALGGAAGRAQAHEGPGDADGRAAYEAPDAYPAYDADAPPEGYERSEAYAPSESYEAAESFEATEAPPPPRHRRRTRRAHGLEFSLLGLSTVQYGRAVGRDALLLVGFSRWNPDEMGLPQYPGELDAVGFGLGYRQFVGRGWNVELQFRPEFLQSDTADGHDGFEGFSLATEVRAGYQLDFELFRLPMSVDFQWVAGYRWVRPLNAFYVATEPEHVFYVSPVPMVLLGFWL